MRNKFILSAALGLLSAQIWAADAITGEVQKQATNWTAIVMFLLFVGATLFITKSTGRR